MKKETNFDCYLIILVILISLTLLTQYYGSVDIRDYIEPGKYFAGYLSSDVRNTHSYLYGFIHFPFIKLTGDLIFYKFTSLLFLLLISLSLFYMTKKQESLFVFILAPIVWYISPWINPLQLVGLLLLWGFYYIEKYNKNNNLMYLIYSGIFIGLAWSFWGTVLYLFIMIAVVFLFNKKLSHTIIFLLTVLIGLIPLFVLDYSLFNFPFYTLLKNFFAGILNMTVGGIYNYTAVRSSGLINIFSTLLMIPIYFWVLYKKNWKTKPIIFLSLVILLFLTNPQPRYIITITPIIILLMIRNLNPEQIKRQLLFSFPIILLVIIPYIIQIKYSVDMQIDGIDFVYLVEKWLS